MTIRVDRRSDNVTEPSQGTRQTIAVAMVCDDGNGEDPAVRELDATIATRFGHQQALYPPAGTRTDQAADAVIHQAGAALGGILTRADTCPSGLVDVLSQLRDAVPFTVPSGRRPPRRRRHPRCIRRQAPPGPDTGPARPTPRLTLPTFVHRPLPHGPPHGRYL